MLISSMIVSREEDLLLRTMDDIAYGEIYSVLISPSLHCMEIQVSPARREVIETLREGTEISILSVHQKEPVYMEIDERNNDFRCRKKTKLPTK